MDQSDETSQSGIVASHSGMVSAETNANFRCFPSFPTVPIMVTVAQLSR